MKERNYTLDITKAICILSIILGHTSFLNDTYYKILYAFHVPLFFIISGYFLSIKKSTIEIIKEKFKTLIIPYFITSIIILIGRILIKKESFIYFCSIFYGSGKIEVTIGDLIFKSIGPVWFLPALFFAIIIVKLISKFDLEIQILLTLIFSVLANISAYYFWLPFSLQPALMGSFFLIIGNAMKKDNIRKFINNKFLIIPALINSVLYIYFVDSPDICAAKVPVFIISATGILSTSLIVYNIAKIIEKLPIINDFFKLIGRHTLIILCIHTIQKAFLPTSLIFIIFNSLFIFIFIYILEKKKKR